MKLRRATSLLLSLGAVLGAAPVPGQAQPRFGPPTVTLNGQPAPPASSAVCGLRLLAGEAGPQVALTARPPGFTAALRQGEQIALTVPVAGLRGSCKLEADAVLVSGAGAEVTLSLGEAGVRENVRPGKAARLAVAASAGAGGASITVNCRATGGEAGVRWANIRLTAGGAKQAIAVPLALPAAGSALPPPILPACRGPIEQALIEWDWRMQDGIETPREAVPYEVAARRTLERAGRLVAHLRSAGRGGEKYVAPLRALEADVTALAKEARPAAGRWEVLWRRVHQFRRRLALEGLLGRIGPIAFVKQVPGAFSHQLTQYYGRYARPGGGVFVLDRPGESMACTSLTAGKLAPGSCQHLEVSPDGQRLLFAYCQAPTAPANSIAGHAGRYYHLYEMRPGGSGLRQLTHGPFDDFSPRLLPNGRIVFISTRRLGWHRCGNPGCENYTLALAEADGSRPRSISSHETHEWDPAVLNDGRVVYTRWDYVDRHAVFYEQLWTVRPDGSAPTALYGNNTYNPVGLWEARAVPGSTRVMATAAGHHGMSAGSIVLVDVARGVDGPAPVTRLTPDAPFPESECVLLPHWRAWAAPGKPPALPEEARRWPGHCYKSPLPLSEHHFLAAYSFDALVGEPKACPANMFGLYLVDRFGNKELLYRDLNIASLWPVPLGARPVAPVLAAAGSQDGGKASAPGGPRGRSEGVFLLQDVYQSDPKIPAGTIRGLRVLQVLPKSTPGINNPMVGLANASPGKQVLGTVPVEADGSACFLAPAGLPLAFQALDERGQAVQIMRSITYVQPGEVAACVGCHEDRTTAPPPGRVPMALRRAPSAIRPGPPGSKPLSYPRLVQPVLDRLCLTCHSGPKPKGKRLLTGQPQGRYTVSYNVLAPRVPVSAWGRGGGNWQRVNSEPIARIDHFGARGSPLMKMLLKGHNDVKLSSDDIERLVTWMDANALFYGTFDPADQARQQRGERIAGPGLE